MDNERKLFFRVVDYLETKHAYPEIYHGISETGYDDKELLTADWNKISGKFYNFLEDTFPEIELDWSDEWMNCSECGKAIRNSPNCYSWTPSYLWSSDCSIACIECYENFAEDIIEYYKNNTDLAITEDFYPILEKNGFICYSPDEYCQIFETGFYPGQNDDPKSVAKNIESELPDYDYIFKIDSVGQFDIHWSVFLRKRTEI